MTSYPKFDELIQNLEESSDELMNLIRVVDTVKTLTNRQNELLTGFDMGNKLLGNATEKIRETQQKVVETVNLGFDGVNAKTQQTLQKGLTDLRSETAKVSRLEEEVITLNEAGKKQAEQHDRIVRQSLAKLDEGINATKTLTGIAQKTDTALRETLTSELTLIKAQTTQSADVLNQLLQDRMEDFDVQLKKERDILAGMAKTVSDDLILSGERAVKSADALNQLLGDRMNDVGTQLKDGQGALTGSTEKIAEIAIQTRGDNRQFYTDFEKLLRIKLDENKSDIRQLIEHERGQMQTYVRQEIEAVLDSVTESNGQQARQIAAFRKTMLTLTLLLGGLLVILTGVGVAKLFGFL